MVWRKTAAAFTRVMSSAPSAATLSTWANIAGGFSTLAAAAVAIWAYFFTDIAEELTKQYNTEVASLNEQVIDLRQERRSLDGQVQAVNIEKQEAVEQLAEAKEAYRADQQAQQASIDALSSDKRQMEQDIASLEGVADQLRVEVGTLQSERAQREKELRKIEDALLRARKDKSTLLVELVTRRIDGQLIFAYLELQELKDEAATARDILEYLAWRKEMDLLLPPDESRDEIVTVLETSKMLGKMPTSWRNWWRPDFNRDAPPEFAELGTKDGYDAFRHRIGKAERRLTARRYIEVNLLGDALSPLPAEDHKRVTKALAAFLKKHEQLLSKEIVVIEPLTARDADIAASGQRVVATLDELEALTKTMADEIGALVELN